MQSGIPFHGVANPVQHFYSLLTKKNPLWHIQKILVKNKVPKLPDSGNLFLKLPNLAKSSCAMLHHPNKKEKKKTLILCMLEFHLNTRDTILKQEENLSCKNNLDNER